MNRIDDMFARTRAEGRIALMPFMTVGYPDLDTSERLVKAMVDAGADAIELGIPFSDPLADGPTIQKASYRALQQGTHPRDTLHVVRRLRAAGVAVPLILMGYWNTFLACGEDRFFSDAAAAGADGLIIVDLPPEESDATRAQCQAAGLHLIYLAAPTSDDARIDEIVPRASGFIYCVGVVGVTGARAQLSQELPDFLRRLRAKTDLPLAVGFGISKREHVEGLRGLADAAIVASALIDIVESSPPGESEKKVQAYVEVLTGRQEAST
ncbi:MAG TPA: tryptophan synthase subunit alpha [Dehalococcoidia bacterium]|nr:tryptophan synthase subunit alpha [Dehalococcoidia bacterium]